MRLTIVMLSLASAFAVAPALQAANGVIVTEKTTTNGNIDTHQIQIDANHMRAEASGANGEKQIVIFDGARQVLDIIHPNLKTYNEMTKADVDQLSSQVSAAMQQMQAQMANMPPEQRARIEAMMKGRMGGAGAAAPAKPVYTKVGTDKVGKWTCDKYQSTEAGVIKSEVCTVSPQALGLGTEDFAVTRQMMEFFSKLVPQRAQQMFVVGSVESQGFPGIPVRRTSTYAGVTTVSEVTDVTRGAIPESAFEVPAGYEKQPFMKMSK